LNSLVQGLIQGFFYCSIALSNKQAILLKMDFELKNFFDLDRCQLCGRCLSQCPVLGYSEDKAKAEKQKLIKGEWSEVLERCKSCFSCNCFCPNQAQPYGLILFRWFERYQKLGIPIRALSSLPVEEKNFMEFAKRDYTREERVLVEEWRKNLHSELSGREVIFVGCNGQVFPYLFNSPVFKDAVIISEPGLCCGEVYYRMGIFSRVEKLGRKLEAVYQKAKPARVIMFCLAGYNMQKNILPKNFGIRLEPEIIYIGDWLLDRVKTGAIQFKRALNRRVAIQESCHGKALGKDFSEKPRELLRLAGAEVIDLNPCREKQICCGAADGITRFNPIDMVMGGIRQWRLAKATGADLFVPYCATCYLMLKMAGKFYPSFIPCVHYLELLTYAMGKDVVSLADKRAGKIMTKVMLSSAGRIFSRKRIHPEG